LHFLLILLVNQRGMA